MLSPALHRIIARALARSWDQDHENAVAYVVFQTDPGKAPREWHLWRPQWAGAPTGNEDTAAWAFLESMLTRDPPTC